MDIVLVVLGAAAVTLIVVCTIEAIIEARVNDEYTLLDEYWDEEEGAWKAMDETDEGDEPKLRSWRWR